MELATTRAHQGKRKRRREIRGQERFSVRTAKQGFIKTTNSNVISCCYLHRTASRRTANTHRRSTQLFMEQYEVTRNNKIEKQANRQDIEGQSEKLKLTVPHAMPCGDTAYFHSKPHTPQGEQFTEVFMDIRNEIKSYIVREDVIMTKNCGKGRGRHRLHGGGAIPAIVAGKITKPWGTTKSSVTPAYEKNSRFCGWYIKFLI